MKIRCALLHPAAVIQVQQIAQRADLHLITGISRVQAPCLTYFIKGNAHVASSKSML